MIQTVMKYKTKGNIKVIRTTEGVTAHEIAQVIKELENHKGGVFASNYEYPGRYARWEIAFTDPCIEIRCFQRKFIVQALTARGDILIGIIKNVIKTIDEVNILEEKSRYLIGEVAKSEEVFSEEKRSKQNSIFTVIRHIMDLFYDEEEERLGLYGAFGYDIVFQFESAIQLAKRREKSQEDLVLFLPDKLYIKDLQYNEQYVYSYDFETTEGSTAGLDRVPVEENLFVIDDYDLRQNETVPGEYANLVERAKKSFARGDLFEVVPSHVLSQKIEITPYEVFQNMIKINPSPYNFFLSLGKEYLVGSSPEMFVRVEEKRIETCPISGTIKRGKNAIEDAENIRILLDSLKEESELTMCTDVDRNDKSRICKPGTVQVIGRRQIEKYSHLIHTVDHVVGELEEDYDAIDAFLTHMWAVTVTGAPKRAAIEWIEEHEASPRVWYGGAVGFLLFNGNMNTGLTLRTVRIRKDIAQIRVGATLLMDSVPELEEEETYTKAAALLESIKGSKHKVKEILNLRACKNKKILIVDHEDSFVHTLGNYIKQLGGEVITLRHELAREALQKENCFDAVILSPGPGKPSQFRLDETIKLCKQQNLPMLGICLGLQGIVEYFGGMLDVMSYPRHGKKRKVTISDKTFSQDIGETIEVGLYHSLYAKTVSEELSVVAIDEEGIVMGVRHKSLPIVALQFHPESILTSQNDIGLKLLNNMFKEIL